MADPRLPAGGSVEVGLNGEKHRIRRLYDEHARLYDRMTAIPEWLGLRRLRRELFAMASGHVLEVAVGTGANLPLYGPEVMRLTGIDLSPGMLEQARRRSGRLPFALDLRTGDAEHLDFPAATFDTVTSALSTCTFPDPVRALREMGRVCRPSGRILLLEHGRSRVGWIGRFQDSRADRHQELLGCRWNREPLELIRAADLRIIGSRSHVLGIFHVIEAAPPPP